MRLSAPTPIRSKGRYHYHDQPRPKHSAARRRVLSPNRNRPARARHDPGEAAAELAARRTVTIAAATTAAAGPISAAAGRMPQIQVSRYYKPAGADPSPNLSCQ